MSSYPPLPPGVPLGPANSPVNPANGAPNVAQFPPGTRMTHPLPPMPPDLQKQLDEARRCGAYFITITILDPAPDDSERLTTRAHLVGKFKKDWLLRTWQTITKTVWSWGVDSLFGQPVPAVVSPPVAAPESENQAGYG